MDPTLPADALRGQRLIIPNLQPAFASWKQGVNPLCDRAKHAVDERLEGLIEDERVLVKLKAADLGLFAAGYHTSCSRGGKSFADPLRRLFPDAPFETLETVAFYSVWLFLWDDAIDGADLSEGGLVAEEYCQQSVAFVRHSLGLHDPGAGVPNAPTKVCESFAEVGRRIRECSGLDERKVLFGHLREYMEACVTEYRWRQSGKAPSVDEFYSWRLGTSSVDAMLDLCRSVSLEYRSQAGQGANRRQNAQPNRRPRGYPRVEGAESHGSQCKQASHLVRLPMSRTEAVPSS